jgi:hypothetical protein
MRNGKGDETVLVLEIESEVPSSLFVTPRAYLAPVG